MADQPTAAVDTDTHTNGYSAEDNYKERIAGAVLALPPHARTLFTYIGSFLIGYRKAQQQQPHQG